MLVTALFATGAVMTYRDQGWTWLSLALGCATVLGLGAVLESLVVRVRLTDDALLVTDLLGRRRYPITDIVGVEEAKGVPTMLLLANGRSVRLPAVGSSLGNSIRAWLKGKAAIGIEEKMTGGKSNAIETGRAHCALCGDAIRPDEDALVTPDFLADETDPFWRFADAAMHRACFLVWDRRKAFVAHYNRLARRWKAPDGSHPHMTSEGELRSLE